VNDRERDVFAKLLGVCRRLRGPDGCPWDREQTLETMTPYLTEEAVESSEAIASGKTDDIAEELGDLAFLAFFCLELLGEKSGVGIAEGLERAAAKLIRRHPHVYGNVEIKDGDAAYRQWQEIKKVEKGDRAASLLGEQPKGLPALVAAYRVQEKAGAVGFDWPDATGPAEKVEEELAEVRAEAKAGAHAASSGVADPRLEEELGDLLFSVVNLCRKLGVHPSLALDKANTKFATRFQGVERLARERGLDVTTAGLEALDELWNEVKKTG